MPGGDEKGLGLSMCVFVFVCLFSPSIGWRDSVKHSFVLISIITIHTWASVIGCLRFAQACCEYGGPPWCGTGLRITEFKFGPVCEACCDTPGKAPSPLELLPHLKNSFHAPHGLAAGRARATFDVKALCKLQTAAQMLKVLLHSWKPPTWRHQACRQPSWLTRK